MKVSYKLFLSLVSWSVFLSCSAPYQAQRELYLSEDLQQYGEKFEVTYPFRIGIPKYRFNTYHLINPKGGWEKTRYRSRIFSGIRRVSSEKKLSFGFVCDLGDSARVNLERNKNYVIKTRLFGLREEVEYFDGLLGVIEINSDEATWNLVLNNNHETIEGTPAYFESWITDGVRRITILPVFDYKNPGKSKRLESLIDAEIWPKGFEFMEGNQSIGAIQITRWAGQFVWFSKENDPKTNFVLGASYAALLAMDLYN